MGSEAYLTDLHQHDGQTEILGVAQFDAAWNGVERTVGEREQEDRALADLFDDLGPPGVASTKILQPDREPSALKIPDHGSDRDLIVAEVADEHFHRCN